jgi:hypothetical protein
MASTKKKRRTKHRGNAAGIVETRGRTGRKPSETERKTSRRDDAVARREARATREPSWRAAVNRAGVSALLFFALILLLFHQKIGPALGLGAFVFIFYIPLGYYTDQFVYRRRLAKKARGG